MGKSKAQEVDAPSTLNPSKHSLLYLFQRRMICYECAEKRGIPPDVMNASLFGSLEGTCQNCGGEWRNLKEVMCVR